MGAYDQVNLSPCVTAAIAVCVFNGWGRRCPAGLVHILPLPRGRILLLLRLLADYVPGVGFVTRKWVPLLYLHFCLVKKNEGCLEYLSIGFQSREGIGKSLEGLALDHPVLMLE